MFAAVPQEEYGDRKTRAKQLRGGDHVRSGGGESVLCTTTDRNARKTRPESKPEEKQRMRKAD